MGDFDAVVTGGGPNGLAAALRLAEAGWSVCLVEANQDVGGPARTIECILPSFRQGPVRMRIGELPSGRTYPPRPSARCRTEPLDASSSGRPGRRWRPSTRPSRKT